MNVIYSEIYMQLILAVTNRKCLIKQPWEADLYRHISDHAKTRGHRVLAINGAEDHIHVLIQLNPRYCLDDVVLDIKRASIEFVNGSGFLRSYFSWQKGYGGFSYSRWDLDTLKKQIADQKLIHKRITFKEEFIQLLKENKVEYKEKELFRWVNEAATEALG